MWFINTNIYWVKMLVVIEQNWKSFYIMKVIYINNIYRMLKIKVRDVQQSLYMGKCKYILKILKTGDKK